MMNMFNPFDAIAKAMMPKETKDKTRERLALRAALEAEDLERERRPTSDDEMAERVKKANSRGDIVLKKDMK